MAPRYVKEKINLTSLLWCVEKSLLKDRGLMEWPEV